MVQILLNDLDVSSSHMERLIKDLIISDTISQNFLDFEVEAAKESISSFTNLVPRFRSTLRVSEPGYVAWQKLKGPQYTGRD